MTNHFFDPAAGRGGAPPRMLSEGEVELLARLGHLVMFWNKCEYFVRQILRQQQPIDDEAKNIAISKKTAWDLEVALNDLVPRIGEPGRTHFAYFAVAFGVAREHRNRFVHGVWDTFEGGGPRPASGLLLNAKPKVDADPLPAFFTTQDILPVSEHLVSLAIYAQRIHVAFTPGGARRLDKEGAPEVPDIPVPPPMLPPCMIEYFDDRPAKNLEQTRL